MSFDRARVDQFRTAAARFCALAERVEELDRSELLAQLRTLLPALYAAGAPLPRPGRLTDTSPETPRRSVEEWSALCDVLREKLGEADRYWVVWDATEPEEPIEASLAQDVADIYEEMKEAVWLLGDGTPTGDVLFELQFAFEHDWSRHVIHALHAVDDRTRYP